MLYEQLLMIPSDQSYVQCEVLQVSLYEQLLMIPSDQSLKIGHVVQQEIIIEEYITHYFPVRLILKFNRFG